jgi:FixJ family two-component response regulator
VKENLTREPVVVVLDDDASVRAALKELIESVGLEVRLYASAGAFLEVHIPDTTSCLVLDVRLPGMNGIKVHEELSRAGVYVPIVFVTGRDGRARDESRCSRLPDQALPKPGSTRCGFRGIGAG